MVSKEERAEKLEKVKNIEKEISIIINKNTPFALDGIHVLKSDVDEHGTMTLTIVGGRNGSGDWQSYFMNLMAIVKLVKDCKYDFWLIEIHNDCPDDIFYAKFGIKEKDE